MSKGKTVSPDVARLYDYQQTFNTESGRRVLRHLMKMHGMMQTSFVEDPYATAFNEGGRNVVIQIFHKLRKNPKELEEEILDQDTRGESDVII